MTHLAVGSLGRGFGALSAVPVSPRGFVEGRVEAGKMEVPEALGAP